MIPTSRIGAKIKSFKSFITPRFAGGLGGIFGKGRKAQPESADKAAKPALDNKESNGRIARAWAWVLPVMLGGTVGWFCVTCAGLYLDSVNEKNRPAAAASASATAAKSDSKAITMSAFLSANPFRASHLVVEDDAASADQTAQAVSDDTVQIVGSLATAILRGTAPGFLAWLESEGKLYVVGVGDSFDVYTLEKVDYIEAVFAKGDDRVVKELYVRQPVAAAPAKKAAPAPRDRPAPAPQPAAAAAAQQVVPADADKGTPGEVTRELVNTLLENPFDEMKKVRIRPSSDGNGLQIQWIQRDSLLNRLGVKRGDVINSINGIQLHNVMDITNSVNSLMNSDRFDLDIKRGGNSQALQYVVK
ncbi:MAG: hypothetical protein LBR38_05560 [Synergistaceae bacterium]|nr:hypothetical protein [Synergistaceae bacterium]